MKKILIVGGSSGIGEALISLLEKEHNIINISRNSITENDNIKHHSCDVMAENLPILNEKIDGLVYCPGSINLKPLKSLSLEDFVKDFEINVLGAVKTIKAYQNNFNNSASVVLFSTVASMLGMPFHASVATSKGAIEGLTKSLAAEFTPNIRFNAIAPTITDTPLAARLLRNEKQKESMKERHPLKKYLAPDDVANLASYLLSDKSDAITGQIFPIDAGIVTVKL